ncbi:hypothetical protein GGR53DRAFT_465177 [Hypoxylon sp. FL1150]|nr:hypothetical protein GGR53DRAFT_465177 [Hypoxylon sp. FL1150]
MGHKRRGRTNQHHCADRSKGNCRHQARFGLKFCTRHNTACNRHAVIHLKCEPCWKCAFTAEVVEASSSSEKYWSLKG